MLDRALGPGRDDAGLAIQALVPGEPLELVVQLESGVASFMGALEGFQSGAVDFLVPLQVPLGRESRTAPWFSARERSRASVYDHVPIQLALLSNTLPQPSHVH